MSGADGTRLVRRRLAWGVAAAAAYVAVFALSATHLPVRVLYNGEAPPPPYRWVRPPATIPGPHEPPLPGDGTIVLTATGSEIAVTLTRDLQATITFPPNSVAPRPGESAVQVRITPVDPVTVPPPPRGLIFDGNAYRFEAFYSASRQPVVLRQAATVVLRYPIHATQILRAAGQRWVPLLTNRIEATLQLFAPTTELGLFIAAGPSP